MKVTLSQLKMIISESLKEDNAEKKDIKITMALPGRPETFTFNAVGDKVDAFFDNEDEVNAKPVKIQDNQED